MTKDEAIKVLKMVEAYGLADDAKRMAIKSLEQPDKHTATWQCVLRGDWIYEQCTSCGSLQDAISNYCPNCGAKMEESEDGKNV